MIAELNLQKKGLEYQLKRQKRINKTDNRDASEIEDDMTCIICTDLMKGEVILQCGHKMCPSCFAQHSRVNNKCPFCRDEFVESEPKKNVAMPDEILDNIINQWSAKVSETGYFKQHSDLQCDKYARCKVEGESHMQWIVTENARIIMGNMRRWYESS